QHISTNDSQPPERTTSFAISRLPRSSRTSRSASLRLTPCLIFSAASISKYAPRSSSNSRSTWFFRKSDRRPLAKFLNKDMARPPRGLQNYDDCRHLPAPYSCLAVEP